MRGSYILEIGLKEDKNVQIGKLGNIFFKKGSYLYVGSALNGIEQRVNRHLRENKKLHWHIDYLLKHATITKVFYKQSNRKDECYVAKIIQKNYSSILGFGSNDCKCKSHLFYGTFKDIKKLKGFKQFFI